MSTNGISGIQTGGIDVNGLFNSCLDSVHTLGGQIQDHIDKITATGENQLTSDQLQTEMVLLQFSLGQYNALLEMTSTIAKSMTDMMKTLAQRSS